MRRHNAVCDVLVEMYEVLGGTAVADHSKALNSARTATVGSVCALVPSRAVSALM